MQAKRQERQHAILMPDWSFYDWYADQDPGWANLKYILQAAAKGSSWDTRIPTLLFRGSSETGETMFLSSVPCLLLLSTHLCISPDMHYLSTAV